MRRVAFSLASVCLLCGGVFFWFKSGWVWGWGGGGVLLLEGGWRVGEWWEWLLDWMRVQEAKGKESQELKVKS